MVNQKVLPETFSVIFDPTVRRRESMDLVGAYRYDNEGVKARRVPVIEKGVLKNFLMSRTPIEGFSRSNGHGRKQAGLAAVARQSNLFVEADRSHSREELKAMLIDSLKREDKPFGLYFKDVQGGFTMTGRVRPNVFNVLPTMVYRIYADGREELVRGVDLIGTPLTAFSKITAADDRIESFKRHLRSRVRGRAGLVRLSGDTGFADRGPERKRNPRNDFRSFPLPGSHRNFACRF